MAKRPGKLLTGPEKKMHVGLITDFFVFKQPSSEKKQEITAKGQGCTKEIRKTGIENTVEKEKKASPIEKKIKWAQTVTPEKDLNVSKLPESISDTFYLDFFVSIYKQMQIYKDSILNSADLLIISRFESLPGPAKQLYVRLFKRKSQWVNLNSLKYDQVPDPLKSFQDLLSENLARSSFSAFSLSNIQSTYDFLHNLTIPLLILIEEHLRKVLADLLNTDNIEIEIEKPWPRALYYYTKSSIFTENVKKIAENVREKELESRKHEIIQAVMEILLYLKPFFHEKSQDELSKLLIPEDFPAFIKLEEDSVSLFSRLHHVFSFFSSENILNDFAQNSFKGLSPFPYKTTAFSFPVYQNYSDSLLSESIYSFSLLLENLNLYHYSPQTNYLIAKGICEIKAIPHTSISNFIENYSNFPNPDWKNEYFSEGRWARVLSFSLEFLQKEKDWEFSIQVLIFLLSQTCYSTKRGFWWERLAIILKSHLGLKVEAEEILRIALTDRFLKSGKRLKLETKFHKLKGFETALTQHKFFDYSHEHYSEIFIKAESINIKGKLRFIHQNLLLSVEELALELYKKQGWEGFHSENILLTSIYGILMWEYIFYDELPFVFQTTYQSAPLDYKSNDFFSSREFVFEKILNDLKTCEEIGSYFIEKYEKYYKKLSHFVNWELLDTWGKPFLRSVVCGLSSGIPEILSVLSMDYRHYCSGMPDLILLKNCEIKFCEVKSTNDKLSDQQRTWIRVLTTAGCKVEVFHISQ